MKKMAKTLGAALALAWCWNAQAAMINLTTAGSTGVINGATYRQVAATPTGSGYIDSFVRIVGNPDIKGGYNTTVDDVYNNDSTDTFNHEITVGQIGFIDVSGVKVMRFLLDINQSSGGPGGAFSLLSLDEVQIYISRTANQSTEPALGQGTLVNLGTLVYHMDAGDNNWAKLEYDLNGGSGNGDMYLDIPLSMFENAFTAGNYDTLDDRNGAFIYLYSRFGENHANNDGYEEWTHIQGARLTEPPCDPQTDPQGCDGGGGEQEVPEPASLAILGLGLGGMAYIRRRRRF